MKKTLLLLALMVFGNPAFAEGGDGQALHDENCTRCHDSGVYTRADRFVTSHESLETQVRRCDANLDLKWFDEDVDAVVNFLDQSYYKFGNAAK